MATEESPLVGDLSHDGAYDRFSNRQKRVILAMVSLTGLVPMFVSGSFVPSIPQISRDLSATPVAVSLGVSLAVFATSLGVMIWSAYNSFYGRRTVYLCGMPITVLGSFAVAVSADLNSLLFWRFVQTLGCSGGLALGAATIGDIYKLEERGTAMGTFFGATLLGLAIAPPIGGVFSELWSWRSFQAALGVWAVMQLLLLYFCLPETAHPGTRGIDKVENRKTFFVWINPFRCLAFLRSPNIMMITLTHTFALMSYYTLFIPFAYTVGAKYGISSEGLLGLLLLPEGCGNFIGAPLAGRISDAVVRKAREQRKGVWVPEDRLRAVWLGTLVLIPLSVVLFGFATTFVDGKVGLAINLVCLFANGMGVDMVLTPLGAYTIDIMPSRSAEVMAATTAFRSLLLAPLTALCIPAVQTIGVAATNSISGIVALTGHVLIWLTIRYGEQMRAYVDVGYPDFHARAAHSDGTGDDSPTRD